MQTTVSGIKQVTKPCVGTARNPPRATTHTMAKSIQVVVVAIKETMFVSAKKTSLLMTCGAWRRWVDWGKYGAEADGTGSPEGQGGARGGARGGGGEGSSSGG